jgi:hypothetical protein
MILVLASRPGARSGVYGPLVYSISYSRGRGEDEWEIYQTDEGSAWMRDLRRTDPQAAEKVEAAVDVLAEYGPTGQASRRYASRLEAGEPEGTAPPADQYPGLVRLRPVAVSDPAGRRG